MTAPKKKRRKKHPLKLTTDEALNRVFHPKIVKALKNHVKAHNQKQLGKE